MHLGTHMRALCLLAALAGASCSSITSPSTRGDSPMASEALSRSEDRGVGDTSLARGGSSYEIDVVASSTDENLSGDSFRVFEPPVTVYGASGTFGTLGNTVPSGQQVAKVPVSRWSFDPGLHAFFTTLTGDGTVFVANMTQTSNQFLKAQCSMTVTCFNPDVPTCYDATTDAPAKFANLRIPNWGGDIYTPRDGDTNCGSDGVLRGEGSDVSDVQAVVTPDGEERVMFNSLMGSIDNGPLGYPALGTLFKGPKGWQPDPDSYRSNYDLQRDSLVACPHVSRRCSDDSDCSGRTCDMSSPTLTLGQCVIDCAFNSDCPAEQTCLAGRCGMPDCGGINEMAVLPHSKRIVGTLYTGERLAVWDTDGRILSTYQFPSIDDPCNPGIPISQTSPRGIVADPTSVLGDERIAISFDTEFSRSMPAQEFRYDEASRTLAPVTAPFAPETGRSPAPDCSGVKRAVHVHYDADGNLWVETTQGIGGGPVFVFLREPREGIRRIERECSYLDPDTNQPRQFGFGCSADFDFGHARVTNADELTWDTPWSLKIREDPRTRTKWLNAYNGHISLFERLTSTSGAEIYVAPTPIDLGIDLLPSEPGERRVTTELVLNPIRRDVWIPVNTALLYGPCSLLDCVYEVGAVKPSWLYRLRMDQLREMAPKALIVTAPAAVSAGLDIPLSMTVEITTLDGVHSGLYAFDSNTSTTATKIDWQQVGCNATTCNYEATIPGALVGDVQGRLIWHGVFLTSGLEESLHLVGWIDVGP